MMHGSLDPRVTAYRPDLAAESLRGQVEAPRFVPGRDMQVADGSVLVRRTPGTDQPADTEALYGECFTVYDEREGWAWGQLATDGYVGYVPSSALGAPVAEATHKVAVLRTYIYPAASIKAPPAALVSLNAPLAVARTNGPFAELAGGAGFVFARHATPLRVAAPDFVAVAERFAGTPYLWAGRTSLGLDCSALVQLSLHAAGIACPRDSDMQEAALGAPVDLDGPLARGDLVFWKGHVGIMSDGETLLHANGHHMLTAKEPFAAARARIQQGGLEVTAVRRLPGPAGD